MAPHSIRFIVFLILLMHGIGHYMGVVSALGVKLSKSSTHHSWMFKNQNARVLCFTFFLVPFFGFIGASLSFQDWVLPHHLWTNLALSSAILSLAGIILFWNALAVWFNKIGAILVNVFTIATILWLHWPPVLFPYE